LLRTRLNLQARLVALLVAALLPIGTLSVWFAVSQTRSAAELARSQLQLAASLIAASQDDAVDSARELLSAVAGADELRTGGRERCQGYFEKLRASLPGYANIGLLNADGTVLCHADGQLGDFSAGDRPHFRAGVEQRRFVMGEVIQARPSGRWSIPFALPLLQDGVVTGVVFAALDLEHAAQALARIELPAGARVTVADRRGQVLMQHPAPQDGSTVPRATAHPELAEAARLMRAGVGESADSSGQPRVYAFAPSRLVGEQGFLVRVGLARDQVTAGGGERLRESLLVLALTLLGGGLGAWWIGGRTIVKPARQILGVVRRLERGHLDARVPVHATALRGEFGRIAAAFNLMAESLEVRQNDVKAELGRSQAAYSVLDSVVNSMSEGLIAVDAAGRPLLHNHAASRVFDLENLPLQPRQWPRHLGMFHPETGAGLDVSEMPLARAMRGERGQQALLVRNPLVPEGRLLQCSYEPLRQAEGGGLVVFTDVTETRRVEADLVLLRNAVARLNDVVLITEAQPIDEPGPRIVFANEAFERLTGYSIEQAMGRSPRMLQGPGTDRAALARIRQALEQGLPVREEVLNYRPDGTAYWIELDIVPLGEERGRYTHLIAVQRDVTARKESERALAELNASLEARIAERTTQLAQQEARYRALAEQAPEIVWNVDPEGRTVFLNGAWFELMGGSPEDWLGHGWLKRVHRADVPQVIATWERARATKQPFSGTRRYLAQDGRWRTMSYRGTPVFDAQGEVAFWVGIDSDVTELKAVEDALRASNRELEAFSYSVSHDLRAPLSAVGGFAQALAERSPGQLDERGMHYVDRIRANVGKMEHLVAALLSLSKVGRSPVNRSVVDLAALAREALEALQVAAPDRQVETVIDQDLRTEADPDLVRLVLDNLLGNAWKFTAHEVPARIEVGRASGGAFYVRDNGVGFDMERAGQLFAPFQRLHSEQEFPGTGIGLATVQRAVLRHGGRVWVESQPGQGAAFYFTLA
jgi:PAS domain S-box-containing protein